jgi:U3 small nucleolar RNA-associated protein 14
MGKGQRPSKREEWNGAIEREESDEEISEDAAFNSEDEAKFGAFFVDKTSQRHELVESGDDDTDLDEINDDQSSSCEGSSEVGLSESDEDDDVGDGGQYMLDLLQNMDTAEKQSRNNDSVRTMASHVAESRYESSVISSGGLTINDLMIGLEDTSGYGNLQRTMAHLSRGAAVTAPLPTIVANRTQRQLASAAVSQDISAWIQAVQQNRQAETLDFRPKERPQITRDTLVDKFVPTSAFEIAINEALNEAGQADEEAILSAEEKALHDDLGVNEITMDEYKRRRSQLAKMRALMFYHEQKRHHMNKIKSRKYRKVRQKQKRREDETMQATLLTDNPQLAEDLQQKEETDRIRERMTLAHKNTSKWAKRILKRGKNVDVETRRALSAQVQRGDDLLNKMKSTRKALDGDETDDEENAFLTAQKILNDSIDDKDTDLSSQKSLFQMSFMKRGIERQREQAKEEARQLLTEMLQEMEDSGPPNHDENDEQLKNYIRSKSTSESAKDTWKSVELLAVGENPKNSFGVQGAIDIELDISKSPNKSVSHMATSEHAVFVPISKTSVETKGTTIVNGRALEVKTIPQTPSAESNPWIVVADKILLHNRDADETINEPVLVGENSKSFRLGAKQKGCINVMAAADLLSESDRIESVKALPQVMEPKTDVDKASLLSLSQDVLVQRAFACPLESEIDEDFAQEKSRVQVLEENPSVSASKKRKSLQDTGIASGWGLWAGEGAPASNDSSQRKFRKGSEPPISNRIKDDCNHGHRKDARKPSVILSEKRIRATADKYMISQVPYPFATREEYERSMLGAIGKEWNVTSSFKNLTRANVVTRVGKIIQPISKKLKQRRAQAKF